MTIEEVGTSARGSSRSAGGGSDMDLTALVGFIKKHASGSFAVKIFGAGLAFAIHLAIARLIGVGAYGIFALMLSWIGVLAVVAQFGQDNGVLHFLPKYSVAGQSGLVRGLRRASGLLVLVFSLLISGTGVVYVHWGLAERSVVLTRTFDVGFLLLPVLAQLRAERRTSSSPKAGGGIGLLCVDHQAGGAVFSSNTCIRAQSIVAQRPIRSCSESDFGRSRPALVSIAPAHALAKTSSCRTAKNIRWERGRRPGRSYLCYR